MKTDHDHSTDFSKTRQKKLLRLEALVKHSIDGIVTFDGRGIIESANPAAARLIGCTAEDMIGQSIANFLGNNSEQTPETVEQTLSKNPQNLVGSGKILMGKRSNGSTFPFRLSLSEVSYEGKKMFAGIIQGMQDQYLAEQKMWQEKERAQQYLNVANTIMVALDCRGVIVLFNKKGEQVLRYSEAELLGQSWFDLFVPKEVREKVLRSYEDIMSDGEKLKQYFENTIIAKDGKRIQMAWHNSLLYDADGNIDGVLSSGNDVTQQKKNALELSNLNHLLRQQIEEKEMRIEDRETKLENAVNKLIQENKDRKIAEANLRRKEEDLRLALEQEKELNEMKSRFVSMASHEFRTPLSTILSSAALLARYTQTDQQPRRDKHIDKIRSAVQNLNGILQEFLSYSKLEEGKVSVHKRKFELNSFCKEIMEEMSGLTKNRQEIITKLPSHPTFLTIDSQLLKNALLNLLSNAIKYSDEGKQIFLSAAVTNNKLKVSVRDQGRGIPEQEQSRLFTRFYRASNAINIKGTGLGLTIVQRYLELMNGEISFESKENEGTTFTILIPIEEDSKS